MIEYLGDYADYYRLREHIEFNSEVTLVAPASDDRWEVALASGEKRIYRGVIICNGHHWGCRYPTYPGKFSGEVLHSNWHILDGSPLSDARYEAHDQNNPPLAHDRKNRVFWKRPPGSRRNAARIYTCLVRPRF